MSLAKFLSAKKKSTGEPHTHTWFAKGPSGAGTATLSIPDEEASCLRKLLVADVADGLTSCKGPNSITEKVTRGKPFRFFADLDFSAEKILAWKTDLGLSDADFRPRLQEKLSQIVSLYATVVADALLGAESASFILTTRLPYKIHLHFPDVIVEGKAGRQLAKTFARRFALEHADLFQPDVVDESVYATGLRMLYCHKGSMGKVDKRRAEMRLHESLFGPGSYCDVYYITDITTWKQTRHPSVEDLALTSLQVEENTTLTTLRIEEGGKGKQKANLSQPSSGRTSSSSGRHGDGYQLEDGILATYLSEKSGLPVADIRVSEATVRGDTVIVPTRCRECPFAKREHVSNQQYFVLSPASGQQRCHDDDCKRTKKIPYTTAITHVVAELRGDEVIELQTDEDRLTAFRGILTQPIGNKSEVAKMNFSSAEETMTPMGYWTCMLPENRYCPVCKSTHDRPENFVQISPLGHRGIGCNLRHGQFYPDPISTLPPQTVNILFNNTINVNVTTTSNDVDIRDFGAYEQFPTIHECEDLNRLCHASLTGRTWSVAIYAYALMRGEHIYQDRTWYMSQGNCWHPGITPDKLFTEKITDIYERLQRHFRNVKQVKWLNQLIDDLGNVTRRKAFIEDLERYTAKKLERFPLDETPHLLGFKNGVFDGTTGQFRGSQSDDYLTMLIPYAIPDTVDTTIEQEIDQFFMDIMPNKSERDFLWFLLALHLRGRNIHNVVMVWSGSGGNGKSVLTHLMEQTFSSFFFDQPPATYFTSDRPPPDRPSVDMVSQRYKRCVIASEPESNKKCNIAFIKFISGNDSVKVRENHSNVYVTYSPRFLVTMLCNEIPRFGGAAGDIRGIWRRLMIFKFRTEFVRNPTLPHHRPENTELLLKMERWPPHFMRMLMRVYQEHLADGLKLVIPSGIQSNVDEQQEENNPVESWLNDFLIRSPGAAVHVHRFERAYAHWVGQQPALKVEPISISGFVNRLQSRGHTVSAATDKRRDPECCTSPLRYVMDIDVRDFGPKFVAL